MVTEVLAACALIAVCSCRIAVARCRAAVITWDYANYCCITLGIKKNRLITSRITKKERQITLGITKKYLRDYSGITCDYNRITLGLYSNYIGITFTYSELQLSAMVRSVAKTYSRKKVCSLWAILIFRFTKI